MTPESINSGRNNNLPAPVSLNNIDFEIKGQLDSNFATCPETRKSITGFVVKLEQAVVAVKSGRQKIVALSVTEAEVIAMIQCIQ